MVLAAGAADRPLEPARLAAQLDGRDEFVRSPQQAPWQGRP